MISYGRNDSSGSDESSGGSDNPVVPTPENGLSVKELKSKIGEYVNYIPDGTVYTLEKDLTGSTTTDFTTHEGTKWRIWNVDEKANKLILVLEGTSDKEVKFSGGSGYDNVVYVLNQACSTTFGSAIRYGENVVEARSINMEDIDAITGMTTVEARQAVDENYLTLSLEKEVYCTKFYENEPNTKEEIETNIKEIQNGTNPTSKIGRSYQNIFRSTSEQALSGILKKNTTILNTLYSYNILDTAIEPRYVTMLTGYLPEDLIARSWRQFSYCI